MSEAQILQAIYEEEGVLYTSLAAAIAAFVNEDFASKTWGYSFSADETVLFLDEPLPANIGTNEVAGRTFSGSQDASNNMTTSATFHNTNFTYTLTRTYGGGGSQTESGSYALDTFSKSEQNGVQWTRIYLKPTLVNGQTRLQLYVQASGNTSNSWYFDTPADYNAAQANGAFRVNSNRYNLSLNQLRN
jgi:hypothetical protein